MRCPTAVATVASFRQTCLSYIMSGYCHLHVSPPFNICLNIPNDWFKYTFFSIISEKWEIAV